MGVRCSGRQGKGAKPRNFSATPHTDILTVVEAMRQYWMPIRYPRAG
jgi:hypothetical protein